jgi:hypothetical protein
MGEPREERASAKIWEVDNDELAILNNPTYTKARTRTPLEDRVSMADAAVVAVALATRTRPGLKVAM